MLGRYGAAPQKSGTSRFRQAGLLPRRQIVHATQSSAIDMWTLAAAVGTTTANRFQQGKGGAGDIDKDNGELIALNVGGSSFLCRATTLCSRLPDGRLAEFARICYDERLTLCDSYLPETREYFFERSPQLFSIIYKFYISGQLHLPVDVCEEEFVWELSYWRIPLSSLSQCCWLRYQQEADDSSDAMTAVTGSACDNPVDESSRRRLRRYIDGDGTWQSSVFVFFSIFFVLLSVVGLIFGSIRDFQVPVVRHGNGTQVQVENATRGEANPDVTWEPHPAFEYVEIVCVIWFTFEYVLRFIAASDRLKFFTGLLNIVDLIAILPFYLELVLRLFGFDVSSLQDIKGAFLVVRVLRILRVVRILKLGRYSAGMRTFALTLRNSARQLGMMGMVLFTGVIFFGTLIYYVEKDEPNTPFTSIPATFWWAIVTMSTVGYGDCTPSTIPGKLIASGAILSGVLVLALPITVIVDNFMKVSGSSFSHSAVPGHIHPPAATRTGRDHEAVTHPTRLNGHLPTSLASTTVESVSTSGNGGHPAENSKY
ncbi:CRE-KVS-1 protein [Aphelenchoides avenae]|nr:CRE-KVS-1 protein [Aphelenchus avenae]